MARLTAALDLNRASWNQILFRPRVLVDVAKVDTSTTMMGQATAVPFFICPTGMSGLAHKAGEPGLAAAAGEADVIQMVRCLVTVLTEGLHERVRAHRGDRGRAHRHAVHAAVRGQEPGE